MKAARTDHVSRIALLDLAAACLAGALWYLWPQLGPWPLLLVLLGQAARIVATGVWLPHTRFAAPLALFLATALFGASIAYNPALAWAKFWVIVGGVALYTALAVTPDQVAVAPAWQRLVGAPLIAPRRLLIASLVSLLALYFLFTNDWARWQGKLPLLDPLLAWLAAWQPTLPGHRLHPNVAGGLLAALLPLQVVALAHTSRRLRLWLLALTAVALLLTLSRGAWAALAISASFWWFWPRGRSWLMRLSPSTRRAALALLLAAALLFIVGAAQRWYPLPDAVANRLVIWRNSLDLANDYFFTGLGLDSFEMAYSSYVMLLHVGYQVHSHNILLNLWLEQGLPGLGAFLWLLWALWRQPSASPWRAAALISAGVILLHGQVDDAFYGSRAVLLLFLPWALLASPLPPSADPPPSAGLWVAERTYILAALLLTGAGLMLLPATRAQFQANLGALRQTRAELSIYQWPQVPLQDELRRSGAANLGPAEASFHAALALDSRNVTANRRLGQIELARGQYDLGCDHIATAHTAAPRQRALRQLLGECEALQGQITRAARLWRTVDPSQGQLALRKWWYDHIGEPGNAALIGQATNQSKP